MVAIICWRRPVDLNLVTSALDVVSQLWCGFPGSYAIEAKLREDRLAYTKPDCELL